jgi:hypothetical protein
MIETNDLRACGLGELQKATSFKPATASDEKHRIRTSRQVVPQQRTRLSADARLELGPMQTSQLVVNPAIADKMMAAGSR